MDRRGVAAGVLLVVALLVPMGAVADPGDAPAHEARIRRPGVAALTELAQGATGRLAEPVIGVATHDAVPGSRVVERLASLGLTAQPLEHLPMTLLEGPLERLIAAADVTGVNDVYPNIELELSDRASSSAINAPEAWDLGFVGEGVGIAVVDTGIDGTHPDLEQRVTRNVKFVGPEYVGIADVEADPDDGPGTIVIPVDEGPHDNSDLGGHGTHVAGIAAADGSGNPDLVGVAPGADLVGLASGDVLFLFTVLAAFDYILEHHEDLDIRVVNNSWGSRFQTFDPNAPINIATRALHDAGIVVVFAAGNASEEMTLNPWAVPPWVIAAGSTTIAGERSAFSSAGLEYDNARPAELPEDGHLRFEGDRLGIYHPDVSAPGSAITSTGTPTGVAPGPSEPGGSVSASGTSMASPHVAGLVAVLLSANPALTPDQVKQVMQVTASRMPDGSALWESGFGFVDAEAAVELVTGPAFSAERLEELHADAVRRVLDARDLAVSASDHWFFEAALPATVAGAERRSFEFDVEEGIEVVRASAAYAGTLGLVGSNEFVWTLELRDAAGTHLATSETSGENGLAILEVDLTEVDPDVEYGTFTLDVFGDLAVSRAPLLYTPAVSVVATQLVPQDAAPIGEGVDFAPTGERQLLLEPPGEPAPGVTSPEGCTFEQPPASGALRTEATVTGCAAALAGYATSFQVGATSFVSEPLEEATVVGGAGELVLHLADEAHDAWTLAFASNLLYTIDAVDPDGEIIPITGGEEPTVVESSAVRGTYALDVAPRELPAGSTVRLRVQITGVYTSGLRLLYGGDFGSQLVLTTGTLGEPLPLGTTAGTDGPEPDAELPATGQALPVALGLLLVAAAAALRRTAATHP